MVNPLTVCDCIIDRIFFKKGCYKKGIVNMTTVTNSTGSIFLSHRAIATIASQATLESYGVVGLTAKKRRQWINSKSGQRPNHGC